MVNTESLIRHALNEGIPMTLVINKVDRLILELRIKPHDAYYKIRHTIEEVNTFIWFAIDMYDLLEMLTNRTVPLTRTRIYV